MQCKVGILGLLGWLVGCTQPAPKAAADTDVVAAALDTAGGADATDTAAAEDTTADVASPPGDALTDATTDAAASKPDPATLWGCAATCGNGVCDPGEAPGSCNDCSGQATLACMEAKCAQEWAVCAPKPGCQKLASCLVGCGGTQACADSCKRIGTTGVLGAYEPLVACLTAQGCLAGCGNGTCDPGENSGTCAQDCKQAVAGNRLCEIGESPLTCAFDCGIADPMACRQLACPAEWAACAADPTCGPALACYGGCKTLGCWEDCQKQLGDKMPAGLLTIFKCGKKLCDLDPEEVCGNGLCYGELDDCPADCPATEAVCGNVTCEPGESAATCAGDCGPPTDAFACMAKHCATLDAACQADPSCAAVLACQKACPLTAEWKVCAKACGGMLSSFGLWTYAPLNRCAQDHGCKPDLPPYCGDGTCQAGETVTDCAQDCQDYAQCGDGYCSAPTETVATCAADCETCETKGCGKPGLVCCKVSGELQCTHEAACDL